MAKRMMVDFQREGYPQFVPEEEEGSAKPCAVGIPWVNRDTLKTIQNCDIKRTGPKGEPLDKLPERSDKARSTKEGGG